MQITAILIITVGSFVIEYSHGTNFSLSISRQRLSKPSPQLRRGVQPIIKSSSSTTTISPDDTSNITARESECRCPSDSSATEKSMIRNNAITCARGGEIEDKEQHRRRREGDDIYRKRDDKTRRDDRIERDRKRQSSPTLQQPPPPRLNDYMHDNQYDDIIVEDYDSVDDLYDQRDSRNRSYSNRSKNDEENLRNKSATSSGHYAVKQKSWFTSKINGKRVERKEMQRNNRYDQPNLDAGATSKKSGSSSPPPPPPPPTQPIAIDEAFSSNNEFNPAHSERIPIHYLFPTTDNAAEERQTYDVRMDDNEIMINDKGVKMNDALNVPFLEVQEDYRDTGRRRMDRDDDDEYESKSEQYNRRKVSPRRDAVTIYMSTRRGAMKVRLGSIVVGAAIGGFVGKSLTNDPMTMAAAVSLLMFVLGFLRNDYGELSRALGLAFVLTLGRTSSVRKEYPTLPHLKAMIRQSPRKPFPPVEDGVSPWGYEPIYRDDPEFKMTYALLAMSCVGSFCGGNVPLIPAWIGGIVGAMVFASMTTGANARGDLGRTMGMRLVGLIEVVLAINSELRILGKAATVGGLIFDKVMIMDRKHRIKDKIVALFNWGYEKMSRTAEQVKEDLQDERPLRRG